MARLKYWLWLATRRGLRPQDTAAMLNVFGTPESAYFADGDDYAAMGLPGACAETLADKSLDRVQRILADCDRLGVRVLTLGDAEYPERLKQIYDPPTVLYVRGKLLPFDEEVAVAVVGARSPSEYGKAMAGKLGLDLARRGALVVSGIAQGIDAIALRGALSGGGSVVSVLGCGVDVVYPRQNAALYEDVAAVGALLSEFPPGTGVESWHFPVRNRIISGLSLGVVAVECAEHSGTLITCNLALDQGRDLFAFSGPADAPMSIGTNLLIQQGHAKLVLNANDVLVEYADRWPDKLCRPVPLTREETEARLEQAKRPDPTPAPRRAPKATEKPCIALKDHREEFTDDERDILFALEDGPLRPDDLVERTQIPARRVLSALTMLQVRGHVTEQPGKRFEAAVLLRNM